MYKGNCRVVVIPTGQACKFDYQIQLVDGEIRGYFTEMSISYEVAIYVKNLINRQLKNGEIKYKKLKAQLLMSVEYWINEERPGVQSKIVNVEEVDIAYQRLLGGKLL